MSQPSQDSNRRIIVDLSWADEDSKNTEIVYEAAWGKSDPQV